MSDETHITTSGGLISAAFIETIREERFGHPLVRPETFRTHWSSAPKGDADLEAEIAAAYELLKERWDAVAGEVHQMDVSAVRSRWLIPLFTVLDFDLQYQRSATQVGDDERLRFNLSHRGWANRNGRGPIVHTVAPAQDLDVRPGEGRGAKSPHDTLQAFLNVSPVDHWAILSNGLSLRLLRDYHHTYSKGYVEFDLENLFEERNFGDFRALYRMAHASRFLPDDDGLLPLEHFYKDSVAAGIKVGEDLRYNVRLAIQSLGNGFLDGELIARLQADPAACRRFYAEILIVVYRVLFLLFAEQRGMMPGRDTLYAEEYSIAALRARAEGDIPLHDDHVDLWAGLLVTFRMLREGVKELGIFGYDGALFSDGKTQMLAALRCRNSELLAAIRYLTLVEREGVLQRISYADLNVEELGSIYESLLEFIPRVTTVAEEVDGETIPPNSFFLDPRGSERKTTGSYYTPPQLVNELVKSALLPVVEDRLHEAIGGSGLADVDWAALTPVQRAAAEAALLGVKVCDAAMGSGAFLIAANNFLGLTLARLRSGETYPAERLVRHARRDVLARCIYGVDLNELAVELAKVSLWINASVEDAPLNFLDHHLKCGNSLVGATPELLAAGVPDGAFQEVTGDNKAIAHTVRRRNRAEREQEEKAGAIQTSFFSQVTLISTPEELAEWQAARSLEETTPRQVSEKRAAYEAYVQSAGFRQRKEEADLWTAAFFWPLTGDAPPPPTHGLLRLYRHEGPGFVGDDTLAEAHALAERCRFFHWHLEFEEVFGPEGSGGFDVVLGNPPWERIKLQEKEFFAHRAPEIANAPTAAARHKMIAALPKTDPALAAEYADELRAGECEGKFIRDSGRFPLTGVGDVNTYAVFAGLARYLINPRGRAGIVVPTGIATDYTYRDFFADVMEYGSLVSLYDFENREGLFPGTHRSYKFSLLTMTGGGNPVADFAFFLHNTDDLADEERRFALSREDLALINPNTRTAPVFRTRRDAELTRNLYRAAPVLHSEQTGENLWGVSLGTMFHSGSASSLFRSYQELTELGLKLEYANRFQGDSGTYLPLYEGKMFMQYDHRAAGVVVDPKNIKRPAMAVECSLEQKQDSDYSPMPRFWVSEEEVTAAIPQPSGHYLIVFKKVTSPTNERTLLATILPLAAANDSIHIVFFQRDVVPRKIAAFLGNLNSVVLDFVARQKLGGVNFNFFVMEQLPILPPDRYTAELLDFIVPRVLELTYTAWDLQPFARDVGYEGPPFRWDEERRAQLRAELDALYAHLYGLTREELDYILDTFPIVRRKDEERYGEYRTKRMVLEEYARLGW